jgi:hypothetical protein
LEIPKTGNWKTIRIYYDGTCAEPNWQGDCKVMKGCEAVPIPDHGDLIDKDDLRKKIPSEEFVSKFAIENAHVIIPAERSEQ